MSNDNGGHAVPQLTNNQSSATATLPQYSVPAAQVAGASKYTQLLNIIEELGKDIRPSYTNNKLSPLVFDQRPSSLELIDKESLLSIVGTYQLQSGEYSGSIYKLHGNKLINVISLNGGVFRFVRLLDGRIVAALTTGSINIINDSLNDVKTIPIIEKVTLLSVSICGNSVLCSDACGTIHTVDLETENVHSFLAHVSPYTKNPCEVWTTLWLDSNRILSGGEDNTFKLWDLRSSYNRPTSINKMHNCGVISLFKENLESIISGSYDDYLRRIDLRNFDSAVCERQMNGSPWSIRTVDERSYILSCMYGGWAIVKKENFDIIHENKALGEALLYDADFSSHASLVISCTFNNYAVNFDVCKFLG
ncbi:unnamed protein product [Thelazia callipaeda]|uniref:methylated diphthine methylhydrolase n=1 Tax=Thelazia callipaeda TaxID=103827 RepID=A0A158RCH4_THECL|nr:unnamed protein product [Thelazia callipaeda]